jgi:hypothetical protein
MNRGLPKLVVVYVHGVDALLSAVLGREIPVLVVR